MYSPWTWNADREALSPDTYRQRVGVKWRNFLGVSGAWEKIDLSFRQAGGLFSISQAPYALDVPTLANDWTVFQSTVRYNIWTKQRMHDAPCGVMKRYPTALPVAGIITAEGVLFPLAFPGLNADRLVQCHEQAVRDLVVFRSQPPGNGPVEVPIEIDFGALPILESTGRGQPARESDFRNDKDVGQGLSFSGGDVRGVRIKAPRVWDSAGLSTPITLRGRVSGTRFLGAKMIPRRFFDGATYPVYADTTSTFYPDPHPETTTVDGLVSMNAPASTWASLRGGGGTAGDATTEVATWLYLTANSSTDLWDTIQRGIALFDTSSLPDSASISAANLGLRVHSQSDAFGQTLELVASTPASNTDLVASDYVELGTTRYATGISVGSLSTSAYNVLSLNATGRAAITTTGISKFGMRLSGDLDDAPPSWVADAATVVNVISAESSGTTNDPYLEVTYESGEVLMPQSSL